MKLHWLGQVKVQSKSIRYHNIFTSSMKNLEIMKNGKNYKLEKITKTTKNLKECMKITKSWNWKKSKIEASSMNYECNKDHFSVKNLPNNLLKEPGPPSQMRSGPGYFSCTVCYKLPSSYNFLFFRANLNLCVISVQTYT